MFSCNQLEYCLLFNVYLPDYQIIVLGVKLLHSQLVLGQTQERQTSEWGLIVYSYLNLTCI